MLCNYLAPTGGAVPGGQRRLPNPKHDLTIESPPMVPIKAVPIDYINQTFAHEGRMPPLFDDNRLDSQYPNPTYQVPIGESTVPLALSPNTR